MNERTQCACHLPFYLTYCLIYNLTLRFNFLHLKMKQTATPSEKHLPALKFIAWRETGMLSRPSSYDSGKSLNQL